MDESSLDYLLELLWVPTFFHTILFHWIYITKQYSHYDCLSTVSIYMYLSIYLSYAIYVMTDDLTLMQCNVPLRVCTVLD